MSEVQNHGGQGTTSSPLPPTVGRVNMKWMWLITMVLTATIVAMSGLSWANSKSNSTNMISQIARLRLHADVEEVQRVELAISAQLKKIQDSFKPAIILAAVAFLVSAQGFVMEINRSKRKTSNKRANRTPDGVRLP